MGSAYDRQVFGLLLGGLALIVAGQGIVGGRLGTAVTVVGFVGVGIVALWADVLEGGSLTNPKASRREILLNGGAAVGAFLTVFVATLSDLPSAIRYGAGAAGAVVLLASGYLQRRRRRTHELDEREVQIRYRAAYSALLVVMGLLFVGMLGVYLTGPVQEEFGFRESVILGSGLTMIAGVLAFKLSEGWFRTRM